MTFAIPVPVSTTPLTPVELDVHLSTAETTVTVVEHVTLVVDHLVRDDNGSWIDDGFEVGHGGRRRVGAVGGLRDDDRRPPVVPGVLEVLPDHEYARELALRTGHRLQGDRGEAGDLRQVALDLVPALFHALLRIELLTPQVVGHGRGQRPQGHVERIGE